MIELCGIDVVEGVRYKKEKKVEKLLLEAKGRNIEREERQLIVRHCLYNYSDP